MKRTWTAVAAAACVAVAALVAFLNWREESPTPPPPSAYAITLPHVELTQAWTQVFEAPLATEFRHLSNDAQSGIRFLVACLNVGPPQDMMTRQLKDTAIPPTP